MGEYAGSGINTLKSKIILLRCSLALLTNQPSSAERFKKHSNTAERLVDLRKVSKFQTYLKTL